MGGGGGGGGGEEGGGEREGLGRYRVNNGLMIPISYGRYGRLEYIAILQGKIILGELFT